MDEQKREEYVALRATIRERGTVRLITFLATVVAWAAIVLLYTTSGPRDVVGSFVSLMILAAGFEVVYQVHIGVERVGRYLQVAHNDGWERTAMAYGRAYSGPGSDPLFSTLFVLATVINLLPVLRAWSLPLAFGALLAAHVLFLVRVRLAVAVAAAQRAQDLKRFEDLNQKHEVEGRQ